MSDAVIPYSSDVASSAVETPGARWERRFERASDWINPIVVKECRQALKSRQFFFSFTLTLLFCWLWSIFGVWSNASQNGDLSGLTMVTGYFFILSFPLLVIVPFSAYRSLTVEREDKTYELLAVTTLKPRQIVTGKLVSALVQTALYISGVLPCFGFTALLQGIDLPMMGFMFLNIVLASISLTMFCLMCAALVQERFWQMLMTVVILIGLLLSFWGLMALLAEMQFFGGFAMLIRERDFWPSYSGMILAQLTWWLVFHQVATSQLTFASDNRSTALRVTVVAQQLVYVGWFAYMCWSVSQRQGIDMFRDDGLAFALMVPALLYWYAVGTFATGESENLSSRVKRQLPESFLGRMFTNWFFPGPGRGYIFAVANYTAVCLAVLLLFTIIIPRSVRPTLISDHVVRFMICSFGYLLIYLGLGTLLLRRIQRRFQASLLLRVLIQVLLLLAGLLICLFWMELVSRNWNTDSIAYYFSPFHLLPGISSRANRFVGAEYIILMVGCGILLLNLPGIIAELLQTKMAVPARIAADLAAKHPPALPLPTNPWDEPTATDSR
jgi:ABC-type transport system involved in multi-copper enzyme maturation permease subunit